MADLRFQDAEDIVAHWSSLRKGPLAPLKGDIVLRAISGLLPRVFLVQKTDGVWTFRLAGSAFYLLYGRELAPFAMRDGVRVPGEAFAAIWGSAASVVENAMVEASARCRPLLVRSNSYSSEGDVETDTVLMPMRSSAELSEPDMFIGLQSYAKTRELWWFMNRPIIDVVVRGVGMVPERREPEAEKRGREVPALRVVAPRPAAPVRFTVIQGGVGA